MTKRAILFLSTAALAITMFSGGALSQSIKVGVILGLTGPTAFIGEPRRDTIQLYTEQSNDKGGLNGKKIELIIYDDGGDASKARTFAQRLVEQDGVVAIIGPSTTGPSLSIIPVVEGAKIPTISLAGAIEIVDPVRRFVFKASHTDRMACEKIFQDLKKRGLSKAALLYGTDGFGNSMFSQCKNAASTFGITFVATESYGPRDTDVTTQLTKIKNTPEVEALIVTGFGQTASVITRNYAQLGMKVPFYQSHGVASQSYIDLSGTAAEGVRLPGPALLFAGQLPDSDPQKKVVLDYQKAFEARFGKPASAFGGDAHDGVRMLLAAIAQTDAKSGSIRDAIEGTKGFVGVNGVYSLSASDHIGLGPDSFRIVEIQNGTWRLVD